MRHVGQPGKIWKEKHPGRCTDLWILNISTVKPQTSQTWKRLYPVAAASENADKGNSGGSGENGILGEEEEEEVKKEEDKVYCHCQRMPV